MKTWFCFFLFIFSSLQGAVQEGKLLLLVYQGKDKEAFELYLEEYEKTKTHNYPLLQKMALGLIQYGCRQKERESKILSLFGASFSSNDETFFCLEEGLSNEDPMIQLVSIKGLAERNDDRADRALIRALSSPYLILRLQAVSILCQKKHSQAVSQVESLLYKTPKFIRGIYAELLAETKDCRANHLLKKLLNDPLVETRLATIKAASRHHIDELVPQIRQKLVLSNYKEQEAACFAIGELKDESSISKLDLLSRSSYPCLALSARLACYKLGKHDAADSIAQDAAEGNLFAIQALGKTMRGEKTLLELSKNSNIQIKLNALLSLLEQKNQEEIETLVSLLFDKNKLFSLTSETSPGETLSYVKWNGLHSSSNSLEGNLDIEIKNDVIEKIRYLSEEKFLKACDLILETQQNAFIPLVTALLEEMETEGATKCLIKHQQQLGAPLVRNYCTLSLYRMKEQPGPWKKYLMDWISNQSTTEFIRFKPLEEASIAKGSYSLTPEEKSQFLIHAMESVAQTRSEEAVTALAEAIKNGHSKNKYAIAGLLLRTTE